MAKKPTVKKHIHKAVEPAQAEPVKAAAPPPAPVVIADIVLAPESAMSVNTAGKRVLVQIANGRLLSVPCVDRNVRVLVTEA